MIRKGAREGEGGEEMRPAGGGGSVRRNWRLHACKGRGSFVHLISSLEKVRPGSSPRFLSQNSAQKEPAEMKGKAKDDEAWRVKEMEAALDAFSPAQDGAWDQV